MSVILIIVHLELRKKLKLKYEYIIYRKKRNVGLIHEFLIRHISKCVVEGNNDEAKKAIDLSKRYFASSTELGKELKLFKIAPFIGEGHLTRGGNIYFVLLGQGDQPKEKVKFESNTLSITHRNS